MVSPARKMNLDDYTPVGSARKEVVNSFGSSQNAVGTVVELGAIFNDTYTTVKNMGEVSTATKYSNPSTPPACNVIPDVEESVEPMEAMSSRPKPGPDTTLDDTLGCTTQKSDGRSIFSLCKKCS
jgi:hypothetical protein